MPPTHDSDPASPRSLDTLRAMIDAIDHEILRGLARRNGLVAEIAAWKRSHGRLIRDHRRERELLADRRDRAAPLGLQPEVIESIYRLVLWASRDRQAALRAEVPPDIEPRTVAIIGGRGGMGRLLAALFDDLGHAVLVADVDTDLTPRDAATEADVVVISVPIEATIDVIRDLGPQVRAESLLMDVTSIKAAPVAAMLESTSASVIGTHPLFGPSVHTVQGQRIVLTPARHDDGDWLDWLQRMLHARGLQVVETTPEDHDRAMAVVQVLTHFSTEVLGRAIASLGVPLEETLRFTSPVYLIDMLMAARHFAQSPELYASIQMSNPRTAEVTDAFVHAAQELRDISVGGDRDAFADVFRDVAAHFGEFTDRALEQSSYLIDRLVERT
ncbi:MAG: bifunctional chorismate mutase/prephenate dehydrogenase [Planctomycetota bacterium]